MHERNEAGATYGWGVVFSDIALSFLQDADPAFFSKFTAHHQRCDHMEVIHRGVAVPLRGNHFSRTSRIGLLRVLQDACAEAGVEIRYGSRVNDPAELPDADLIVAADGVNSEVRTRLAEHFKPSFEVRRNKFAWYGTHQLFHPVSLIFRETEYGVFIAHSYQYSHELSTFLVEVDPDTWHRAGLDTATEEESRASARRCLPMTSAAIRCSAIARTGSRPAWCRTSTGRTARSYCSAMRCAACISRWAREPHGHAGRHRAVRRGLRTPRRCAGRVSGVEDSRRDASAKFQDAARRSLDWYESVDRKMKLDPVALPMTTCCAPAA